MMKKHTNILFTRHGIYWVDNTVYDNGHVVHQYRELHSSHLYKTIKQFLLLTFSETARFNKMKKDVYVYMRHECENTWHPYYMKYFDEWFSNCSDYQIKCFSLWMKGKMGPFNFK